MHPQRYIGLGVFTVGLLLLLVVIPLGVVEPSNVEQIALAPQFWPKIIAVLIALMGALLTVQRPQPPAPDSDPQTATQANADGDAAAEEGGPRLSGLAGFACVVAALLGFYWLIPQLGMVVPGMALIFTLSMVAGERRFGLLLLIAVAVPLLLYLFFTQIASIPIPLGVFEALRG